MKRAVVTGGAGFIGSHLTRTLLEVGYEVLVVDNLSTGHKEDIPEGAVFHEIDILDTEKLQEVCTGADVLFHLAALPRVTFSTDHPVESHRANIDGTMSVLMAAKEATVGRVVLASSSSVYGDQDRLPLTEDMTPRPQSLYALQKYTGEGLVKQFCTAYGMSAVSLRLFSVYGSGMRAEGGYALAIPILLDCKARNIPFPLYGDGTKTRDYTNVHDVINAFIRAGESEQVGNGEVLNIAAGHPISINDLIEMVGVEKKTMPARSGEAQDTYGDSALAKKLLGWEPTILLSEGLKELQTP